MAFPRSRAHWPFVFFKKRKRTRRTKLTFYLENKKHEIFGRRWSGLGLTSSFHGWQSVGYLWKLHHYLFLCRIGRNFSHVNELVCCFVFLPFFLRAICVRKRLRVRSAFHDVNVTKGIGYEGVNRFCGPSLLAFWSIDFCFTLIEPSIYLSMQTLVRSTWCIYVPIYIHNRFTVLTLIT